jgi:hypothetical protein
MHKYERLMEVHGMSALQQVSFVVSAVIWVSFLCDLLAHRTVDCVPGRVAARSMSLLLA